MPTAWYLIPYEADPDMEGARKLAFDDGTFSDWAESECMGDQAIAKVTDSQTQLDALTTSYTLICSGGDIDAEFDLSTRAILRALSLASGYTESQVAGMESSVLTYRQWMTAMLTYRYKPRLVDGDAVVDSSGELVSAGILPQ